MTLLSPGLALRILPLWATQAPAVLAHAAALAFGGEGEVGGRPAPPPTADSLPDWVVSIPESLLPVALVALRAAPARPVQAAALLATSAVAAASVVWAVGGAGLSPALVVGCVLSLLHLTRHALGGGLVASFPPLDQRRYLRVRARLPAAASDALALAAVSAACVAAAGRLGLRGAPDLADLATLVPSTIVASFSLQMAALLAEVVATEGQTFPTPAADTWGAPPPPPLAPLVACLGPGGGPARAPPLVGALALRDLCRIAEAPAGDARRDSIFRDASGGTWSAVASPLLAEAARMTDTAIAALVAPGSGKGTSPSTAGGGLYASRAAIVGATGGHARAAAALRLEGARLAALVRGQRVAWAVRSLAGLVAAARDEDGLGLLQHVDPTLARVLAELLSLVLALRALRAHARIHAAEAGLPRWIARALAAAAPRQLVVEGSGGGAASRVLDLNAALAAAEDASTQAVCAAAERYEARDLEAELERWLTTGGRGGRFGTPAEHVWLLRELTGEGS